MPNWCHNKLRVTGSFDALQKFAEAVAGTDPETPQPLSFERILPTPAALLDVPSPAPRGMPDWYTWRCDHWGTKWDASFGNPFIALGTDTMDVEASPAGMQEQFNDELLYEFNTAWSPPLPVIAEAARQHPDVTFILHYAETGMDYAGRAIWVNGVQTDDAPLSVEDVLSPEEMWF